MRTKQEYRDAGFAASTSPDSDKLWDSRPVGGWQAEAWLAGWNTPMPFAAEKVITPVRIVKHFAPRRERDIQRKRIAIEQRWARRARLMPLGHGNPGRASVGKGSVKAAPTPPAKVSKPSRK